MKSIDKVLVLGGVGLIGSHLCTRLLDEGKEVFCLDTRDVNCSPTLQEIKEKSNFRYIRHNLVNSFGIHCSQI